MGRAPMLEENQYPRQPLKNQSAGREGIKLALGRIRYQKSTRKMKSSDPNQEDQELDKLRFFNRNPT
jgi:hypothetical protein